MLMFMSAQNSFVIQDVYIVGFLKSILNQIKKSLKVGHTGYHFVLHSL